MYMTKSNKDMSSKDSVIKSISDLDDNNKKVINDFLDSMQNSDMPETLFYNAINQFGLSNLLTHHEEINEGGITSGYPGYNHHSDTVPFFKDNQNDIIEWLKNRNNNIFGYDSIVGIFKDSQYISSLTIDEINQALYSTNDTYDEHAAVANLLSWMVGEQICYELYHFITDNGATLNQ